MEKVMWWTIPVPVSLITDQRLPHASRALYMTLLSQCPSGATECSLPTHVLMRLSRFGSLITLSTHLKHLEDFGWLTIIKHRGRTACRYRLSTRAPDRTVEPERGTGETIRVPGALVTLAPAPPLARWLYAFLIAHVRKGGKRYRLRQRELTAEVGIGSRMTVRTALAQLRQAGWLWVDSSDRRRGWTYELLDPHLALRQTELRRARVRLRREKFIGEGLAKELLTLLIDDVRFQDNARLGILVNPRTGERMELDRWYPEARVAVEFHGSQHFAPSEKFSEEEVNEQQARDLMKESLARRHGIKLLIMTPETLSIEAVSALAQGVMPLRTVREEDPVVRFLRGRSKAYMRSVAEGRSGEIAATSSTG